MGVTATVAPKSLRPQDPTKKLAQWVELLGQPLSRKHVIKNFRPEVNFYGCLNHHWLSGQVNIAFLLFLTKGSVSYKMLFTISKMIFPGQSYRILKSWKYRLQAITVGVRRRTSIAISRKWSFLKFLNLFSSTFLFQSLWNLIWLFLGYTRKTLSFQNFE